MRLHKIKQYFLSNLFRTVDVYMNLFCFMFVVTEFIIV
jgi:hypothetical protein